jgi:23S rRNA pseudouridine1911/1915/1917 synthase
MTDLRSASRTQVQEWIVNGRVTVNGMVVRRTAARVALGSILAVTMPSKTRSADASESLSHGGVSPQEIELDVLYEDDHLLVINKPAGMVVHPAYRNTSGTAMNGLLWRARDWPAPQRPSIVGRLDKLTSGLVVVARTASAHASLQRAMAARTADKDYLAVVYGRVNARKGAIELRVQRDPADRRRVLASQTTGALSITRFERLARVAAPRVGLSLLRCRLLTGRMHQIRVHLAAQGWPVVGDPVYGEPRWSTLTDPTLAETLRTFSRQALHAWRLSMIHPATGLRLTVEASLPCDFQQLLQATSLAEAASIDSLRGSRA